MRGRVWRHCPHLVSALAAVGGVELALKLPKITSHNPFGLSTPF